MLTDIIPAPWRAKVYAAYAIVTALLATTVTVFAILEQSQPEWLTVTTTIVVGIGTAFGLVAKANITLPAPAPVDPAPVVPTSVVQDEQGVITTHYSDGTTSADPGIGNPPTARTSD